MRLYRVGIRPVASFSSPLHSDTLFGAFCWSFRYYYGESELAELLRNLKDGTPEIIFSNGFPGGALPLPLGICDPGADFEMIKRKEARRKAYQEHKKLKNAKYVKRNWFEKIQRGDYRGFTSGLTDDLMESQTLVHNMVSRDENTVKNIDGAGSLYGEDEYYVEADKYFDIYILSQMPESVIKPVIFLMFQLGIGKNKSTGKGTFDVIAWEEEADLLNLPDANAYMALSNFIPASSDPSVGAYKTVIKHGKLDREYAASDTPFKKPLLFLAAGAVFQEASVKKFYGSCVSEVSVIEGIVTNAYTIAVPLRLNLEYMQEG